jgi:hypothetical protein
LRDRRSNDEWKLPSKSTFALIALPEQSFRPMRELPIAAFGGKRAAQLIDEGEGEAVLAWLDSLDAGSFA